MKRCCSSFDWLECLIVSLLSAGMVIALNRQGAGLSSDTLGYARFPISGDILDLPTHHGIFYPLLLRIPMVIGMSLSHSAILINGISAVALTLILTRLLRVGGGLIRTGGVWLLVLLVIFSYPVMQAHAYVMTEAVFLTLVLSSFCALCLWEDTSRIRYLWVSILLMAAACLTRYAGVAFAAAVGLCMLLFGARGWRKWMIAAGYGMGVLLPLIGVAFWNRIRSGTATNRELAWRWIPQDSLEEGAITVASWWGPYRLLLDWKWLAFGVAAGLLLTLVALCVGAVRRRDQRVGLLSLAGLIYVGFLALSIQFFDVSIMLDQRMLGPLAVMLLLSIGIILVRALAHPSRWIRSLAAIVILYWAGFTGLRAAGYLRTAYQEGHGFASIAWQESAVVAAVAELRAEGVAVYSNAADALTLIGISSVRFIPHLRRPTSGRALEGGQDAYEQMIDELREGRAVLAHVYLRYWPPYLPKPAGIVAEAGLMEWRTYVDGVLYKQKDSNGLRGGDGNHIRSE